MPEASFEVSELDISEDFVASSLDAGVLALDLETTGLDPSKARIRTVQLRAMERTIVVDLGGERKQPPRLVELISNDSLVKVVHHAPFDLGFLGAQWGLALENVFCTKASERVLHPGMENSEYSLAAVVRRYFEAEVNKEMQASDWSVPQLSVAQYQYAATDVEKLIELRERMMTMAESMGIAKILQQVNEFLPTVVALQLRGVDRLFEH